MQRSVCLFVIVIVSQGGKVSLAKSYPLQIFLCLLPFGHGSLFRKVFFGFLGVLFSLCKWAKGFFIPENVGRGTLLLLFYFRFHSVRFLIKKNVSPPSLFVSLFFVKTVEDVLNDIRNVHFC